MEDSKSFPKMIVNCDARNKSPLFTELFNKVSISLIILSPEGDVLLLLYKIDFLPVNNKKELFEMIRAKINQPGMLLIRYLTNWECNIFFKAHRGLSIGEDLGKTMESPT
jgi:hypothetical protein